VGERRALRERDGKLVLQELEARFGAQEEFRRKGLVELLEANGYAIYFLGGEPSFARGGGSFFPLLTSKFAARLPKVIVDMGAVPHVCNGADVMAPGIRRVDGQFGKGAIVAVADEKHAKDIAVAEALEDSATIVGLKRGKVLRNLHYVGDTLWNVLKNGP